MVKGYKAFDKDLKCRGMQYEVGKTFEVDGVPGVCIHGLHFCEKAADVFNFYDFNCEKTRVCEVIAHGDIDREEGSDTSKCATNQLEIVRELSWEEFLVLCNTGKACTGLNNTGDYNTGNRNTGNRNTGDYNTGYGNTCDCSNGVFCTVEPTVNFFNKPSNMTLSEFIRSDARYVLDKYMYQTKWVYESDMSEDEKAKHPEYETTGGYLKAFTYKEAWQNAWSCMSSREKEIVKAMPNFDAVIFEEITGIKA